MKQTVNYNDFRDAFRNYDRLDNFPNGLEALFDFIEELDEQCETETELDVIALCCEFSEHDSAVDCVADCGYDAQLEAFEEDEKEEAALDYLLDNTMVIEFTGGIIIQDF